jgi:hypothetical protein
MSDTLIRWTEIIFNILYLSTVWIVTSLMFRNRSILSERNKRAGILFMTAFFLLALGDTGHVGFRVIAYALGGLEQNPVLVGAGSLATAITVTFFYMLVCEIWRVRFDKKRGVIWWAFIATGVIRLALMVPPQNRWGNVVPPFTWSLLRNIPLMVQGIGIAIILLVSGIRAKDALAKKISIMIFISYACYTPVILLIQKVPMLGMLMIPKTVAYIVIAFFAYSMFRKKGAANEPNN